MYSASSYFYAAINNNKSIGKMPYKNRKSIIPMVYSNPLLTIDIFCHRENPIIRSYLWWLESNCKSLGSIVALQDTTKELNSIGLHSCAFNPLPLWLALNLWDLNLQIGLYYLPLVVSVVTGLTQGHQVEGLLDCFHGNHTCSV